MIDKPPCDLLNCNRIPFTHTSSFQNQARSLHSKCAVRSMCHGHVLGMCVLNVTCLVVNSGLKLSVVITLIFGCKIKPSFYSRSVGNVEWSYNLKVKN